MKKMFKTLLCAAMTGLLVISGAVTASADSADSEEETVTANPDGYNIVLHNIDNDTTLEAKADSSEGLFETVSATFTVKDGGGYEVLVYTLNAESGNSSLCVRRDGLTFENDEVIKVRYTWSTDELQVTAVNPDDDDPLSGYTIVMQNTETEETFQAKATAALDMYDTFYAEFDVEKGTYDVVVYTFNEEGGRNSLCASTQVELSGDGFVTVFYYTATDEIEIESDAVVVTNSESDSSLTDDSSSKSDSSSKADSSSTASSSKTNSSSSASAKDKTENPDTGMNAAYLIVPVGVVFAAAFAIVRRKHD
jgi:hypothetical protein